MKPRGTTSFVESANERMSAKNRGEPCGKARSWEKSRGVQAKVGDGVGDGEEEEVGEGEEA